MEKSKVPYKYFKITMLVVWILAILCIASTWIGFSIPNNASLAFACLVDSFLTISVTCLAILLLMSGRKDYKVRGWMFVGLDVAHTLLFVLVVCFRSNIGEQFAASIAVSVLHTLILIAISVIGIYFWSRNKYVFKSAAEEDAVAAFGGNIEQPKEEPKVEQPKEPKPVKDEKTGIVSL